MSMSITNRPARDSMSIEEATVSKREAQGSCSLILNIVRIRAMIHRVCETDGVRV
jgi:hypothetical protein